MKKILLLLFVGASMFGCNDEENNPLDPNAMISLRPASGVTRTETNPEHLDALEIVKQATDIWFWNKEMTTSNAIGRGFAPAQKDIENVRLLMWGTDIIDQHGNYMPDFIESEDMVLTKGYADRPGMDTLAYIKNATLRLAEIQIKEAFAKKDYKACYEIFDEAFTFIPVTGAEWRELKAKDEN